MGTRHLHVVPGDAGEAGVAGVAQRQDALERGGAPVELVERGDGVGLVEVEHLRVEQAAGGVELVADAVGIGPQRLARDEELVAVRRQMRARRPTRPPRTAGRCRGGSPRGRAPAASQSPASSTVAAQQAAPPRMATLLSWPVRPRRRRSTVRVPLALSCRTLKTTPTLSARTAKRPGSMSVGPMNTLAAELLRLGHGGVGVGHREVDAPDRWHLGRHLGRLGHHAADRLPAELPLGVGGRASRRALVLGAPAEHRAVEGLGRVEVGRDQLAPAVRAGLVGHLGPRVLVWAARGR